MLSIKVVKNQIQLKGRPKSSHPIMNVLKRIRIRFFALKMYRIIHHSETLE